MVIEKQDSFIKQISLYLKNEDYQKAYEMSKEFKEKFPNKMISHFLFAKSSFWLEKYVEAEQDALKAVQLSKEWEERLTSGILLGTIYSMKGEYEKAYTLLVSLEGHTNKPELEEMLIICSVAMENDQAIDNHINRLYAINRKIADSFLAGIIGELGEEEEKSEEKSEEQQTEEKEESSE